MKERILHNGKFYELSKTALAACPGSTILSWILTGWTPQGMIDNEYLDELREPLLDPIDKVRADLSIICDTLCSGFNADGRAYVRSTLQAAYKELSNLQEIKTVANRLALHLSESPPRIHHPSLDKLKELLA